MRLEIWLTIGLLGSAIAQAFFTWWQSDIQRRIADEAAAKMLKASVDEQARRRHEEVQRKRRAGMVIWAESIRFNAIHGELTRPGALQVFTDGAFDPHSLRIANASEFVREAALLSEGAAALSASAIGFAQMTVGKASLMVQMVNAGAARVPPGATVDHRRDLILAEIGDQLGYALKNLAAMVHELTMMLDDAANHFDRDEEAFRLKIRSDSRSILARSLAQTMGGIHGGNGGPSNRETSQPGASEPLPRARVTSP